MTADPPLIAAVDICVVGSGSAGSTAAGHGAVRNVAPGSLRARLAADGAILGREAGQLVEAETRG
jgi:thioredoxin reductase